MRFKSDYSLGNLSPLAELPDAAGERVNSPALIRKDRMTRSHMAGMICEYDDGWLAWSIFGWLIPKGQA